MTVIREVSYPAGDPSLPAIRSYLCSPDGSSTSRPVVLILRGVAGPMEGYFAIARRLCEWGYHALIHNWQVRGNDPADDVIQRDLAQALAYIDSDPDLGRSDLAVMGFCRGGIHAFFAAQQSSRIAGLVIFHGFCYRGPARADADNKLQPIDLIASINKMPVMLLHGDRDRMAPIEGIRKLHVELVAAGMRCELHEFENADHGFAVSTHPGYSAEAAADAFVHAKRFLADVVPAPE